jgi:hypothetical protein
MSRFTFQSLLSLQLASLDPSLLLLSQYIRLRTPEHQKNSRPSDCADHHHQWRDHFYSPMESLPRLPASRVSLGRELARGSSGVIFSALYRECECRSQDQRCTHTARTVCLKVTCVRGCVWCVIPSLAAVWRRPTPQSLCACCVYMTTVLPCVGVAAWLGAVSAAWAV